MKKKIISNVRESNVVLKNINSAYLQFLVEFLTVAVQHGEVKRSEVGVEVFVNKFVVYSEVVCISSRFRFDSSAKSNEVEAV